MYLAKKDDDPDRVRPQQRGNDERRIGQEKKVALFFNYIEVALSLKITM